MCHMQIDQHEFQITFRKKTQSRVSALFNETLMTHDSLTARHESFPCPGPITYHWGRQYLLQPLLLYVCQMQTFSQLCENTPQKAHDQCLRRVSQVQTESCRKTH